MGQRGGGLGEQPDPGQGLGGRRPLADDRQERLAAGRVYREIKRGCLVQFMVKEVRDEVVVADFNDQRAGTWAEFDILVKEVRPATKDEMKPACAKLPESLQ